MACVCVVCVSVFVCETHPSFSSAAHGGELVATVTLSGGTDSSTGQLHQQQHQRYLHDITMDTSYWSKALPASNSLSQSQQEEVNKVGPTVFVLCWRVDGTITICLHAAGVCVYYAWGRFEKSSERNGDNLVCVCVFVCLCVCFWGGGGVCYP